MSPYKHATNMYIPFDAIDLSLLALLKDYRIGCPVQTPAAPGEPPTLHVQALKARGFVGLYISEHEFTTNEDFRKRTGWEDHGKILGQEWEP